MCCAAAAVVLQGEAALWRRLYSSEAPPPRRGWDRFYPKGKARRPATAEAKEGKGEPSRAPTEFRRCIGEGRVAAV